MKILKLISLAGALILGAVALWDLTFGMFAVLHVYGVIMPIEMRRGIWYIPFFAALIILVLLRKKITVFEYACRPLWLLTGVFFWPKLGMGAFCFTLAVVGWTAWRLGALHKKKLEKIPEIPEKYALGIIGGISAVMVWWVWYMQCSAFNGLFLIFGDWGQYTEAYMRLAHGAFSLKELIASAGHFNFLINIIMSGAIFVYPAAETVFLINAVAIVSAAPLSYLLAKSNGLKNNAAFLCALLAMIYPVFTRQTTSLLYGFHPVVFFIPVLLGFFIARSRNSKGWMWVFFAVSLLIQETVAVFWIGWGLYEIIVMRRYRFGSIFILFLAAWFIFLVLCVQPWAANTAAYGQSFHYAALGKNPLEIAMSPFSKPVVFWGTLFSARNVLFAAILLTPVLFAAGSFPAMLLVSIPILGGIFMQSSEEIKTPLLQYGIESGTLCWALTIINLGRLKRGELPWFKSRGNAYYGAVTATAAGVITAYVFFGYGLKFGLYPGEKIIHKPDALKVIAFLKSKLPENPQRVLLPERLRGHFMFDYKIKKLSSDYKVGDWLIIDMHDPVFEAPEKVERLRRKLYNDPDCRPVTQANWYGKQFVLIHIAPPGTAAALRPLVVTRSHFDRAVGVNIPSGVPEIAIKYDGRMLHFRIDKRLSVDYDVGISLRFPDGHVKSYTYPWFYGLFPAWAQKEGTLWSVTLPTGFTQISIEFKIRPESGVSATPAGQGNSNPPAAAK